MIALQDASMTVLEEDDWFYGVLLETYRDWDRSISRPRVRPIDEIPSDIRVRFPRGQRDSCRPTPKGVIKSPSRATSFRADDCHASNSRTYPFRAYSHPLSFWLWQNYAHRATDTR